MDGPSDARAWSSALRAVPLAPPALAAQGRLNRLNQPTLRSAQSADGLQRPGANPVVDGSPRHAEQFRSMRDKDRSQHATAEARTVPAPAGLPCAVFRGFFPQGSRQVAKRL